MPYVVAVSWSGPGDYRRQHYRFDHDLPWFMSSHVLSEEGQENSDRRNVKKHITEFAQPRPHVAAPPVCPSQRSYSGLMLEICQP